MASTYEKIATTTTTGSATTVTFSSISGAYTDLVLISNAGAIVNGSDLRIFLQPQKELMNLVQKSDM